MINKEFEKELEAVVDGYLEDYSLEEFLEEFDLTPFDTVLCLFNSGMIDEEVLKQFLTVD